MNKGLVTSSGAFAVSIFLVMMVPQPAFSLSFTIPERFGVVDVIPNNQSGETTSDVNPSLAVGTGTNFGKLALVDAGPAGQCILYTSQNSGIQWTDQGAVQAIIITQQVSVPVGVYNGTMDWSAGGLAYYSDQEIAGSSDAYFGAFMNTLESQDPTLGINFTDTNTFQNTQPGSVYSQPMVTVVNAGSTDQIYIGYGNNSATPSVHLSVNSGASWYNYSLEHATPGISDQGNSVRIATSSDGMTVYGIFERNQSNLPTPDTDEAGDMVIVRDDLAGVIGFISLPVNGSDGVNDTVVATNVVFPESGYHFGQVGTWLGSQALGGNDAIAVNPNEANLVYVAYTEVVSNTPIIRVQQSSDSGRTFQLVYSTSVASSFPALAVSEDGTVGLLFAELSGLNMEVHFLKAAQGDFTKTNERVLASFPDGQYIGNYFQLKSVGDDFYGTFCASGDPQLGHFPSKVYYQRNVEVGGIIQSNFTLTSTGSLVDTNGNPVAASMDPFFFYDIASQFFEVPILEYVPIFWIDPSDPLKGTAHISWPVLPLSYPQYQLQSSTLLGPEADWTPAGNVPGNVQILQDNGMNYASMGNGPETQFFRLSQNAASGQFGLFASADNNGALDPSGVLVVNGLQTQSFTATPNSNYQVSQWYLDGVAVQPGSPTLTISNIDAEHTVLVTFTGPNTLAVTAEALPAPLLVNSNFNYLIRIQNTGINPQTGVTLSNTLPATVSFVSANVSQGTIVHLATGAVIGNLGVLNPGGLAIAAITVTPNSAGAITDLVNVTCDPQGTAQATGTATDIHNVILPVGIASQPMSQMVRVGATVNFTVGASGTPPIFYQWFFNGSPILNGTNAVLTLTDVTNTQAGSYSASLAQVEGYGAEDIFETNSAPATLTVNP